MITIEEYVARITRDVPELTPHDIEQLRIIIAADSAFGSSVVAKLKRSVATGSDRSEP